VFRNPPGSKAAGELIEAAGLKGVRVGDAEVSTTHANFIVNRGHAKASEVIGLITRILQAVFEASGVDLKPEVTIIGEEEGT
jgi:UDP-N-acetylmuramate dehydrogenase